MSYPMRSAHAEAALNCGISYLEPNQKARASARVVSFWGAVRPGHRAVRDDHTVHDALLSEY